MENNDLNNLIEILENADRREASELMTEGFDGWCHRRQKRRRAVLRSCLVLLVFFSVSAIAVNTIPSLHSLVFPAPSSPAPVVPPVPDESTPVVADIPLPPPVRIPPKPIEALFEPVVTVPSLEQNEIPQIPRFDFRCLSPSDDTLGCLISRDGNGVSVTCLAVGPSTKVCVPERVEHNGEQYSVVALGDSAFYAMGGLRGVSLPSTLTHVGKDAFALCSGLDTLEIFAPDPPQVSGDWCFYGVADSACLVVSCGNGEAYRLAPQWDGFARLVDPCEPAKEASSKVTIIVNGTSIVVEGVEDERVDVYDARGRLVATALCKGHCTLTVSEENTSDKNPNAAYWVQVGSRPRQQVFLGAVRKPSKPYIIFGTGL